jgi:hypothetical protein
MRLCSLKVRQDKVTTEISGEVIREDQKVARPFFPPLPLLPFSHGFSPFSEPPSCVILDK